MFFSAYEVVTTKASEYFSDGDIIGVFAYYLEGGVWSQDQQPGFMYNAPVKKSGSSWNYQPLMYWPSMSENQLRFYAYSPHTDSLADGELVLSGQSDKGAPLLTFSVTDGGTDLLASHPVQMSRPAAGVPVFLEFEHLLGKLQFKFAVSKSGSFSYVRRIKLYGIHKSADFSWSGDELTCIPSSEVTDFQISSTSPDGYFVNTTVPTVADQFTSHLIPGQIQKLGVQMNNGEEEIIDLTSKPLSITAGEMLSISFTIHMTGLTVDAKIVPWTEGGTVTGGIK